MLIKFTKIIFIFTTLAVVYINMQMKIINLAYEGKDKENVIRQLIEDNGNITFDILTLKSANHIGIKMLREDSEMKFVDPENIVRISTEEETAPVGMMETSDSKNNPLLSLLSFGTQAEARQP
ncbi:MAG: hypothetical protein K8S27_02135 [Candidatus Omnitrophica bacterium]|nr:hypothetical protein [Candidatus Omnitrophota bacterium]